MNVATTSGNINGHPKQAMIPSARLRDTKNVATPELHSHHVTKSSSLETGGNMAYESPSGSDSHYPLPSSPSLPSSSGGQKHK